jgi:ribosomal protein S18 acetylase RimI-like enzyme
MKEYVEAIWGWDERFQREHFSNSFNSTTSQIIVVDGRDVGELAVEERSNELFLSGIYILPEYQNRGLGTTILRSLLARARTSGRSVTLQVLKVNPARRLYERLGFVVVGSTETHFLMKAA